MDHACDACAAAWAPVFWGACGDAVVRGGVSRDALLSAYAFLDAVQRGCAVLPEVPAAVVQSLKCVALRLAVWNDHVDTLRALIALYVTSWNDGWGLHRPPLHQAATYGSLGAAAALLEAGADVNAVIGEQTAVGEAACHGHVACVSLLLKAGARLDVSVCQGPLQQAAEHGHVAVVELLLEARAQVDHRDTIGVTALSYAIWSGHDSVAALLLQKGANVNNRGLCSPLRQAILSDSTRPDTRMVATLLHAKADVTLPDSEGQTAISLGRETGRGDILALLEAARLTAAGDIA